jgi:hypothetical protein
MDSNYLVWRDGLMQDGALLRFEKALEGGKSGVACEQRLHLSAELLLSPGSSVAAIVRPFFGRRGTRRAAPHERGGRHDDPIVTADRWLTVS